MSTRRRGFTPAVLAFTLAALNVSSAPGQYTLLHSLFDPGTNVQPNVQQGLSVAVEGNFALVAVASDNVGATNSGGVRVYDATTGVFLYALTKPSAVPGDRFGSALAISGMRVVVGAGGGAFGQSYVEGTAYIYDLNSVTPTNPVLQLTNPTPSGSDHFGYAAAISGNRVVVGAYGDGAGAPGSGSVYLYDLNSATPTVAALTLTNPSPASDAGFGYAVAICGPRIVVGAYRDDTGALDAGIAYVYDVSTASPASPVFTLPHPNPGEYDYFGNSVAVAGTRVVVAAYQEDKGALAAGGVYVFDLASSTPAVPAYVITNPTPSTAAFFGNAVAIEGTRLVVGADWASPGSFGAAYVYDFASATPGQPILSFTNPTPAVADLFGASVSISGTRVLIGAPADDTSGPDSGSAYVFDLSPGTPSVPFQTLTARFPSAVDHFGAAVALSGNHAVIGAPLDDAGATDSGRVYIYDFGGATPLSPVFTLTNPSPAASDLFGSAVAIDGTRVVVGAYLDNTGLQDSGSAYVYDLAATNPLVPVVTLNNPSPGLSDYFGSSVAISGVRVVVGAYQDDTGTFDAGSAYVYDLSRAMPSVPVVTFTNPTPAQAEYFGFAVAISGARVMVGAYRDRSFTAGEGSVYVYDLDGTQSNLPVLTLTNPIPASSINFGYALALSGTRAVVGAFGDDSGAMDSGSAFVYDFSAATPKVPIAVLTNPSPAIADHFGRVLGISGSRVVIGARNDDTRANGAGIVHVYELASATPRIPVATLSSPNSMSNDRFGIGVAIDGTTIVAGAPYDDTHAEDRGAAYVFGLTPALRAVPAAPGLITLTWAPPVPSGFLLQYSDSLAPPNWIPASSGSANPVTVSSTNALRFYRLAKP